jgi:FkbH-like protein
MSQVRSGQTTPNAIDESSALARAARMRPGQLVAKIVQRLSEASAAMLFLRGCTRVGRNARVTGRPVVNNHGRITIGDRLQMTSRWSPIELSAARGGSIHIGNDVTINYGTLISARDEVRIGDRAQIGNLCVIADTEVANTSLDPEPSGVVDVPRPIEIGADVWLAVRVTVLPGAHIGDGAVITAGSVVAGTIPPRVVAGGNPARILRSLEPDGRSREAAWDTAAEAAGVPQRPAMPPDHRGILAADFTIDELAHLLAADGDRPGVEAQIAPFNQVAQSLLTPAAADARDFLVVWTRPEGAIPSFAALRDLKAVAESDLLSEVDQFCDLIAGAASSYRFVFVPTWTVPWWHRGLGLLDAREGTTRALPAINVRLMQRLAEVRNVHVLNSERWVDAAGRRSFAPRGWYMGKLAFPTEVLVEAARDIKAALGALTGLSRKVVVLDLDDTLWGGTVGEQGWQNLSLGGHDANGEAFVDFQRGLKALTRRGVLLAIVSRNEEDVALEAINHHPAMVLRSEDFVGWRINWADKAQNIVELAAELNLGLQSLVFIDNDPVQRARVREALTEVLVPDWPEDPLHYPRALHELRCFDTPALTRSDSNRAEQYAAERQRQRHREQVGSVEEWLKSLDMRVRVHPLSGANVARVAQLFNRTNQMNLSTRRLTAEELASWANEKERKIWALSVSDRFGDAGLTGVVSVEVQERRGRIIDFILSCRVMGRKVENTMVHIAVEHARQMGADRVEAHYRPTQKNKPCLAFWETSGFTREDGGRFLWDTNSLYTLPEEIHLETEP